MSRTSTATVCWEHQHLLEEVASGVRDLARFAGDEPDHQRAREILTELADCCRSAAGVFELDPTLVDEPHDTGRYRAIDLLAELSRQSRYLLRNACSSVALDRWPRQARWDELDAPCLPAPENSPRPSRRPCPGVTTTPRPAPG